MIVLMDDPRRLLPNVLTQIVARGGRVAIQVVEGVALEVTVDGVTSEGAVLTFATTAGVGMKDEE